MFYVWLYQCTYPDQRCTVPIRINSLDSDPDVDKINANPVYWYTIMGIHILDIGPHAFLLSSY
jgi:hypothetical protein